MFDPSQTAAYVAPVIVVVGTLWRLKDSLWNRFEAKLNENEKAMMAELNLIKVSLVANKIDVAHLKERAAWLEGSVGRPLQVPLDVP